ncbi:hypothetical protein [Absidia glauca]|uniref:Uncharacterized protein n=1 Tax=Absidia glauca TaxID=4829 RepID=A0A163LRU1_ABSGL|nr:hypothetical protein [Absidia glauca]
MDLDDLEFDVMEERLHTPGPIQDDDFTFLDDEKEESPTKEENEKESVVENVLKIYQDKYETMMKELPGIAEMVNLLKKQEEKKAVEGKLQLNDIPKLCIKGHESEKGSVEPLASAKHFLRRFELVLSSANLPVDKH